MSQDSEKTVVYITEKGQICYDRIDPKDLCTATKPSSKWGKKQLGSTESCCSNKEVVAQEQTASVLHGEKWKRGPNHGMGQYVESIC